MPTAVGTPLFHTPCLGPADRPAMATPRGRPPPPPPPRARSQPTLCAGLILLRPHARQGTRPRPLPHPTAAAAASTPPPRCLCCCPARPAAPRTQPAPGRADEPRSVWRRYCHPRRRRTPQRVLRALRHQNAKGPDTEKYVTACEAPWRRRTLTSASPVHHAASRVRNQPSSSLSDGRVVPVGSGGACGRSAPAAGQVCWTRWPRRRAGANEPPHLPFLFCLSVAVAAAAVSQSL